MTMDATEQDAPSSDAIVSGDGPAVTLGPVLAKAGEGTIHEVVGQPGLVAKVFHSDLADLPAKLDKVTAMIAAPPPDAIQPDGFVVLTWPRWLLPGDQGPIGYLMSRVDTATAVEIHTVSNPYNRANPLPTAPQWTANVTWQHLVHVAANLCLAVQAAHRVNAVIGDFQERNILVADTTRVSLVDCDSMQFTDASGRRFLCGVARPEFLAPELASANLRVQARELSSDLFALAVHIHLLLLAGNHPFQRGIWTPGGDQPDAMSLAQSGDWAGGPNSRLQTHPLAPPVNFLPDEIQHLFASAFTTAVRDPAMRPTAADWRAALLRIRVIPCSRGMHQVPIETATCPWCGIDNVRTARKHQQHMSPNVTGALSSQIIYPVVPPVGAVSRRDAFRIELDKALAPRKLIPVVLVRVLLALVAFVLAVFVISYHSAASVRVRPDIGYDIDRDSPPPTFVPAIGPFPP